ncbi:GSCOCG00011314001-RA-CDS [Cotesia congregata]|nr:GSCOCG00011314001-RA-CDS [Cotesia congregata]
MELSDSENSDNEPMTPPELSKETEESAEAVEVDPGQHTIPEYSREKYFRAYEVFKEWQLKHDHDEVTEAVMLEFFEELNETKKPSTLWSQYSMLKSTFNLKEDLDISQFKKLRAYLKKQGTGFKNAKSKVLSAANIHDFLIKASDYEFLAEKVIMIFGVVGACRKSEIVDLTLSDLIDSGTSLVVTIQATPRRQMRKFTIDGDLYNVIKKYMNLRPDHAKINRLLLNYQKGKCTQQPIGINKVGGVPRRIASFLELPEADKYTGHCFRRTSAELLSQSGTNVVHVIAGWKANKTSGKTDNSLQFYSQMEASNILKTCMSDIQQPQSHPSTQIIINQIPINQQVGGRQFQVNQGQIITTPKRLYTSVGQIINNAGQLNNSQGQQVDNSGQVDGNSSQAHLDDNQQVDSGQKSTGQLHRVQVNKQINVVQKPKAAVVNQQSEAPPQTLNLDGFKFVVVEIDRRIEVVQKGWSPPEGAEYVKPHAIFDSYKSASDYADTINAKKTPRVASSVAPSPKVISIDADSSNFKSGLPTRTINVVKNRVAATSTPGGSTPKRIIGTLVKKNDNQRIQLTSANGLQTIVNNKRFIGTLVNQNFTQNSIASNKQNLNSQNAKSSNVFIVVEKFDNSSNFITGDVSGNANPPMQVDTKDPTLTSTMSGINDFYF